MISIIIGQYDLLSISNFFMQNYLCRLMSLLNLDEIRIVVVFLLKALEFNEDYLLQ